MQPPLLTALDHQADRAYSSPFRHQDNGMGMPHDKIPDMLGRVLSGPCPAWISLGPFMPSPPVLRPFSFPFHPLPGLRLPVAAGPPVQEPSTA